MKKTTKLFSVLLAVMLVFAMAIPAFAATAWTGDITIKSSDKVSVDGKTFNAYKILDAQAVDANNLNSGVIYSIPESMASFFATYGGDVTEVTEAIAAMDDYELHAFAADALAAAKTADITPATATGADNKATFNSLDFGYYVIEDTSETAPISALMLKASSVEVTIKTDIPSIEKKIDGNTDKDNTTSGLVDFNTALIGEKVPYVLTSKVPKMDQYTTYTYIVTDTFSNGLDFQNDVKVTVNGEDYTDFTVKEDGQTITITFNNFIALTDKAGKDIKITYSALVTDQASVGSQGNLNKAYLTYSSNPNDSTETDDTEEDVVYTYLSTLVINKTDAIGAPLAGASFAIKQGEETIATGTSDENGLVSFTWTNGAALKDGETYTIVETNAPAGYNKADDITFTVNCADPTGTNTECVWTATEDVVYDAEDDRFEATIKNLTGTLLPETGGIGTTIFYIVGGLLVIGAAILLITKKRMSAEA